MISVYFPHTTGSIEFDHFPFLKGHDPSHNYTGFYEGKTHGIDYYCVRAHRTNYLFRNLWGGFDDEVTVRVGVVPGAVVSLQRMS